MLAKLRAGDIIAWELEYHHTCLPILYRKELPKLKADDFESHNDQTCYGLYWIIQEEQGASSGGRLVVFRPKDLAQIYQTRVDVYGVKLSQVNSGKLKTRLLAHTPDLQAHTSGSDVMLTCVYNLNSTLKVLHMASCDCESSGCLATLSC